MAFSYAIIFLSLFSARLIQPELLDHVPPEVARPNLADLIRINRYFGGHSILRGMLQKLVQPGEEFTLLDVGAASGDSARLIQSWYPSARVVSLDYNFTNLEAAPRPKVIANAFALPFPPRSFDFVASSLFLHHFTNEQVVELLRAFYKTARRACLISDLERHIVPYLFLPMTKPFFGWNKITIHDGKLSVRAAFRRQELQSIAASAGLTHAELQVHRPAFRISMIARKAPA
jgi:ubiquinone/menaquinone biosynthesis C-methylase UbiE